MIVDECFVREILGSLMSLENVRSVGETNRTRQNGFYVPGAIIIVAVDTVTLPKSHAPLRPPLSRSNSLVISSAQVRKLCSFFYIRVFLAALNCSGETFSR